MIEPPVPIVWAKLQPPVLTPAVVERTSLVDELRATPDGGSVLALTAIVAPAGYGKTTVAVQLAAALDRPVAWLALEPADNDPVRFWTYVAAALGAAGLEGVNAAYAELMKGTSGIGDALIILRMALERGNEPTVLVLDDLHAIVDASIEGQLSDWLRHPLANLHVICTSRRDLPLPVGRLRSQGRLTEARVDRLAFDSAESSALLGATFGLHEMSGQHLDLLQRRTEGWPVGLYLAGLGLRHEDDVDRYVERFAGDTRHLTEYLATEAVDGLSDDERAFVLATSVVTTLVPDLCDELTGRPGSLGTLRALVADNIFTVAIDEAATQFRYHPLFREHLQSTLGAVHPETLIEVNERASIWYGRHGDIDQAIKHAIDAGRFDRACDLVGGSWALFAQAGLFATLDRWIAALGEEAKRNTGVGVMMSWSLLNLERLDEIDLWLDHAEQAVIDDDDREMVRVEGSTIRAHRARHLGDVGALDRWASAAVDAADLERPVTRAEGTDRSAASASAALAVAGSAAYWRGDLPAARDLLTATVSHARRSGEFSGVVLGYGYLAMVEAEAGRPELAIAHADQVLAMIDSSNEDFYRPAPAHLARSVALLASGRPADAAAALAEADRVDRLRAEPLTSAAIALQQARIHHAEGDRAASRRALRSARAIVEGLPDARFADRIRTVENETRFVPLDAPDLPPGARELTEREQAVLAMLPHGLSRRELAEQLHVSENTVKTHLSSIRHKLGVAGRDSIVDRARSLDLL